MDDESELVGLLSRLNFQRAYAKSSPGRDYLFMVTGKFPDLLAIQSYLAQADPGINFVVSPSRGFQDQPKNFRFASIVGWMSGTFLQLAPLALISGGKINLRDYASNADSHLSAG